MSECYSEKLDEILENKTKEIDIIYYRKFEKKNLENDDEKKEVLTYDVKKIICKQKTHENKRLLKSKAHQNKLDMELSNILANSDKL